MTAESESDLRVLAAVHRFSLSILQKHLGHEIPVPESLFSAEVMGDASSLTPLQRWLGVLDLAITPLMVRDALENETAQDNAEALLCYLVMKSSLLESDRDKTDFVATFLYRNPRVPGRWELRPRASGAGSAAMFEQALIEVLGQETSPALPEEHRQLLREFEAIRIEVEDFKHFDALMDSGIVQRVREKKLTLGRSFYHPHALAIFAAYNAYFRLRFDDLFRAATQQITTFAAQVQQQGAAPNVKILSFSDAEEKRILKADYGRVQDQLRRISQLKKTLDGRQRANGAPPKVAVSVQATGTTQATATPLPRPQPKVVMTAPALAPAPVVSRAMSPADVESSFSANQEAAQTMLGKAVSGSHEEGKLRTMQDTVRNFVLSAEPKSAHVIPLRHGNLMVTSSEVDAFRAAYWQEQSFRGDFARVLMQSVALLARISSEIADFHEKQASAYLWKPHADSLTWLISDSNRLLEKLNSIAGVASQRGLADKANALANTATRIRQAVNQAATLLQSLATDRP